MTFNAALKNVYAALRSRSPREISEILSDYLAVVRDRIVANGGDEDILTNSVTFRALIAFFIPVATRVKDRFGADYSIDSFESMLDPLFNNVQLSKLSGSSQAKIVDYLEGHLKGGFQL